MSADNVATEEDHPETGSENLAGPRDRIEPEGSVERISAFAYARFPFATIRSRNDLGNGCVAKPGKSMP